MYDPMVAKLIVWDNDRELSTARMLRALDEYEVGGLQTLIPFHQAILETKQWAKGETCRDLTEDKKWLKTLAPEAPTKPADGEDEAEKETRDYQVEVGGKLFDVKVIGEAGAAGGGAGAGGGLKKAPKRERKGGGGGAAAASEDLISPLLGTILKVAVELGAEVAAGDLVCVIEAMKMENEITAPRAGMVSELPDSAGASVSSGDLLAYIELGRSSRGRAGRRSIAGCSSTGFTWPCCGRSRSCSRCSTCSATTPTSSSRAATPPATSSCWRS
jgi:acetyl-CoA/propionyl-CoA carboxylase biotin carboxyl carrier protein